MTLPSSAIGIIGGADGPTSIFVASAFPWTIVGAVIIVAAAVALGVYFAKRKK